MQTSLFIGDHPARTVEETEENPEIETRDQDLGEKMIPGIATVVLQGTDIIIITEKREEFLRFPRHHQHLELITEISATEGVNPVAIIEIGTEEDNMIKLGTEEHRIVIMLKLGTEELTNIKIMSWPIPSVFLRPIIEILTEETILCLTVDTWEATASSNIPSLSLPPVTLCASRRRVRAV